MTHISNLALKFHSLLWQSFNIHYKCVSAMSILFVSYRSSLVESSESSSAMLRDISEGVRLCAVFRAYRRSSKSCGSSSLVAAGDTIAMGGLR